MQIDSAGIRGVHLSLECDERFITSSDVIVSRLRSIHDYICLLWSQIVLYIAEYCQILTDIDRIASSDVIVSRLHDFIFVSIFVQRWTSHVLHWGLRLYSSYNSAALNWHSDFLNEGSMQAWHCDSPHPWTPFASIFCRCSRCKTFPQLYQL